MKGSGLASCRASASGNGISGLNDVQAALGLAVPGQRPALGSSPGRTARVQWVQPMLG